MAEHYQGLLINGRGESGDIGLASIEGTEPVKKMEYMSGGGISRPAKTSIITERNGEGENVACREAGGKRQKYSHKVTKAKASSSVPAAILTAESSQKRQFESGLSFLIRWL